MINNNTHVPSATQRADPARELEKVAAMSQRSLGDSRLQRFAHTLGRLGLEHHLLFNSLVFLLVFVLATLFFRALLHQTLDNMLEKPRRAELVYVAPASPAAGSQEASSVQVEKAAVPAVQQAPAVPALAGDCAWQEQEIVIKALASGKASDYVYFVALADSKLCVMDSRNQTTSLPLRAGETRTVRGGTAPWRVRSSDWSGVKIFFQGSRVAVPVTGAAQVRIELSLAPCVPLLAQC